MSNPGQIALRIVGTVAGAFFGNPMLGYTLGSLAGDTLFPTDLGTVSGPRLSDLQFQTATIGATIPLVYGKFAISGNVVWASGIIETVHKEKQGGKGGPTQTVKTYTYSVNIAVGICEGKITDILRICADSVLIFDRTEQQQNEEDWEYTERLKRNANMLSGLFFVAMSATKDGKPAPLIEIYYGDEEQLPDPTIESWEGVGNVSGYRGLAYVVFTEFQLADYGNRIPNFRFEVVRYPLENPQWNPARAYFTGNTKWLWKDVSQDPNRPPGGPKNIALELQFDEYEQDPQWPEPDYPPHEFPKKPHIMVGWIGPQWTFGVPEGVGTEITRYGLLDEYETEDGTMQVQPYQLFDTNGDSTLSGVIDWRNMYGPIGPGFNTFGVDAWTFDNTGTALWESSGEVGSAALRWRLTQSYLVGTANPEWNEDTGDGVVTLWYLDPYGAMRGGGSWQFSTDGTQFFAGRMMWRSSAPFNLMTRHGFDYNVRVRDDPNGTVRFEIPDGRPERGYNLQIYRSPQAVKGAYVEIGTNGIGNYDLIDFIPFMPGRKKFRVTMATTAPVGTEVRLRLRAASGDFFVVAQAFTTVSRPAGTGPDHYPVHEDLIFDFNYPINGMVIPHLIYNKMEISFAHDIGGPAFGGHTFYIDEIEFLGEGTTVGGWYALQFNIRFTGLVDQQLQRPNPAPLYFLKLGELGARQGFVWPFPYDYEGRSKLNPTGQEMHVLSSNGVMAWVHFEKPWDLMTGTIKSQARIDEDLSLFSGSNAFVWAPDGFHFWFVDYGANLREYAVKPTRAPDNKLTLGEVVADVCYRCGLTVDQVDVSDLTEIIEGYAIGSPMSGRDIISPLRSFGFFDCVESDYKLKWPKRGKSALATYRVENVGARTSGSSRVPSVRASRVQEHELPQQLRVHYAQLEKNYEAGEQRASRISVRTSQITDVEVAVAMSDKKAAQIAEVLLYEKWVSRTGYSFSVGYDKLENEAADPIICPIEGRTERVRITSISNNLAGVIDIEAVRDDNGVYVSHALGTPNSKTGDMGSGMDIPGRANGVLLDLPLLRDTDNEAGYYAAMATEGGSRFPGGVFYRSPDGGVTYEQVAVLNFEATMGTVEVGLPTGPTDLIDEGNELVIKLTSGDLEPVSEEQLLAGLNAAAIGSDDRWEIVQFRDVAVSPTESNVFTLSGLLRGRRGTEWARGLSRAGDRFVLLDTALVRIPMGISFLGVAREHRAVLIGQSLEAAPDILFTGEGVALEPFAVTHVEGERDVSGNLSITWIRRGRIGMELASTGYDVPLSEANEAYEIDIIAGEPVVRASTASFNPGHYVSFELNRQGLGTGDHTFDNALHPGVVGVQVRYMWNQLENATGTAYTFDALAADLDAAAAVGLKLIVMVMDKTFIEGSVAVPAYLVGHTYTHSEGNSPFRWKSAVYTPFIELIQALGAEFNGHPALEAIATQETAIGIPTAVLTAEGYTVGAYADSYIAVLGAACNAFPDHQVFWYQNYMVATPGVANSGQNQDVIVNAMLTAGHTNFCMGGPDILHENNTLNSLTYPFYNEFAGQLPLFCSCQFNSYHENKTGGLFYTMSEQFARGRDFLNINYCVWNYRTTTAPEGGYLFDPHATAVIAANPIWDAPYSPDVIVDTTTVVRTISTTIESADYLAVEQAADFGSPQASITVRIYQLSAVVGRGYPAEATL